MNDDLRHFQADDYYSRPDAFSLISSADALKFLVGVLSLAMILDVCGLLK